MKYLLRIEGVNLDNFLFDTRDLSTIRGGSLMLLRSIEMVRRTLVNNGCSPIPLSMGASVGLFEIDTSDVKAITEAIENELRKDNCRHATFVVDAVRPSGNFQEDIENLIAANHWRQMQALSLAVPAISSRQDAVAPPACNRDGMRPGLKSRPDHNPDGGSPGYLSEATYDRREYGRDNKQSFYRKETKNCFYEKEKDLVGLPEFAQDFQ
jgi:hypothetical protein